jgi:hypothetical protein
MIESCAILPLHGLFMRVVLFYHYMVYFWELCYSIITGCICGVKEKRIIHCKFYTVKSSQVIPFRPRLFKWRYIVLSSAHQHSNDSNNSTMRVHSTTTLFILCKIMFLQVSLVCPIVIAPSGVSGLSILNCPFMCLWFVHSWLPFQVSLVCPFLISISGVSGLSILDCPFRCLWFVQSWLPFQVSLDCPCIAHSWLSLPFILTFIYTNKI